MNSASPGPVRRDIHVPLVTLLKLTAMFLLIVMIQHTWSFLILFFLAILCAVALEPLVSRLEKWMPRWLALLGLILTVGGSTVAMIVLIVPPLFE